MGKMIIDNRSGIDNGYALELATEMIRTRRFSEDPIAVGRFYHRGHWYLVTIKENKASETFMVQDSPRPPAFEMESKNG